MTDTNALRERVAAIISEQMSLEPPSADTDLFDTGFLDSLAFVDLLTRLEREFGFQVSIEELEIEHFRSVAKIAEFAARKSKNGFGKDD